MKRLSRGLVATAALALVWLGCDSVTPIAPADAILTITVNPTRIESGGEATVTVLARKVDGFPVNRGTEISFSTDLGRIDPEVAFTDEQGRASTTLFGNGEVGMATVTAVSGSIEITAETLVQIGSAPNSLILEVSPPEVNIQRVDRRREFKLRASVVDDRGEPLGSATVRFESDIGKLASRGEPIDTNSNGVARDNLTVTKEELQNAGSSFFVTAVVTGGDDAGFIELIADEEVLVFGFPFDIFLETSQSSVAAEGDELQLIATVLDDLGNPLFDAGVQFESSAGTVASRGAVVRTDGNGQAFDFLQITEQDIASITGNTVTVTARVFGADDLFLADNITLNVQGQPPVAGFTVAVACRTATFTNTSTPASTPTDPVEYTWDFGDGSALLLTNVQTAVSHEYTTAGPTFPATFTATLTAVNTFGTGMVSNPVVIDLRIMPMFTAVAGQATSDPVTFNATSSTVPEPAATYSWEFGDGATGTGVTTTHTYAAAGNYTATLTITACEQTQSTSLNVVVP